MAHHERIVEALDKRDAEAAIAALNDLMHYTRDQYAAADKARQERSTRSVLSLKATEGGGRS